MIDEVKALLEQYEKWLRDRTLVRAVTTEWVEITTPFLDRHNDYIQIYARKDDQGYLLTDDGHTLGDLEASGCELDTPKRKALLRQALNGFGVQEHGGRLEVKATADTFPLHKHNLAQAILAVGDMFYLASPVVENLFWEDVMVWFDLHDVRYTPNVKITGHSGFDHEFNFVIPRSRKAPERFVQTINKPSKQTIETLAFAWMDTRTQRPSEAQAFALLNDTEHGVSESKCDALRNYGISPVRWSQREEHADALAA